VCVEIERLGWDLSAGFGYGRIGIKLVNLKCFFDWLHACILLWGPCVSMCDGGKFGIGPRARDQRYGDGFAMMP